MSAQPEQQVAPETNQGDVFTVELPWGLPSDSPFVINELEFPLLKLQQLIIDDLQAKLEANAAPRNKKLKELYDAMKADREDLVSSRDRALAGSEVMRKKRNEAEKIAAKLREENEYLVNEKQRQEAEIKRLTTELRHANEELAGVPKRIENSVSAALAEKTGLSKEEAQEYERKLSERSMTNAKLNEELAKEKAKNRDLEVLTMQQAEICKGIETVYDNAEAKWTGVMKHISDVNGYAALLTHENETLKNDNLLHALMLEYEQLKTVYENDEWKAIVMCSPSALTSGNGDEKPSSDYAVCFCVSQDKGCGHFVYLNEDKKLTFPKDTPIEMRIPEECHADLEAGLLKANLKQFNELVDRTSERAKNIIHYARLLDVEWSKAPTLVEVCTQLHKYLPESDVKNISEAVNRGRMLIPQTNKKIAEINERYGTEFPMIDRRRTQQLVNPVAGKVNNKKKRKKRK
ncbi:hypothetical protein [Vibrio alginolyticus]|uniref:hypothetical protein n=1 Tax=Vibrio alginolyticus TaxID=663 RepID=UPI00215C5230|nr:hypothetical protein [Vibrio alginolyticus]MCR9320510.1 hypothetical protein [Vibrio alginolyticus]